MISPVASNFLENYFFEICAIRQIFTENVESNSVKLKFPKNRQLKK